MNHFNSTIQRKTCKCGCGKMPTTSYSGYHYSCATEEIYDRIKNKRIASIKKSNAKKRERAKVIKLAVKTTFKPTVCRMPIPIASKKRLAELKIYSVLKKDFILDHPTCECGLPDCNKGRSVDIHHPYMGRDRAKYFLEVDTWKAVSRRDHFRIHNEFSSEQLVELGLRKID